MQAAVDKMPDDWLIKGELLNLQGHHEQALLCFNRLLAFRPRAWRVWVLKSFVLLKLGREEESLTWIQRVLELEPRRIDLLNNASVIHLNAGRLRESLELCRSILSIDPEQEAADWARKRIAFIESKLKAGTDGT